MKTQLIIVSGASASGKTQLSEYLRDELKFPLLTKETFKETLMDVWPPANREETVKIGEGTWPLLFTAIEMLVDYVPGLIAEANFQTGFTEPRIEPYLSRCECILIYCHADRETTLARIESRKDDPDRHAGHFDQDALPTLFNLIEKGAYRLDLPGVPLIDVDTTDGYHPSINQILDQLKRD